MTWRRAPVASHRFGPTRALRSDAGVVLDAARAAGSCTAASQRSGRLESGRLRYPFRSADVGRPARRFGTSAVSICCSRRGAFGVLFGVSILALLVSPGDLVGGANSAVAGPLEPVIGRPPTAGQFVPIAFVPTDHDMLGASHMPLAPDGACRYVNLACATSLASEDSAPPLVVVGRLALAEADQDLDSALAMFAPEGTVNDHAGQIAHGRAQIRQWLQLRALPGFRRHQFDSRQAAGARVNWVDMLADDDGSLLPVLAEATIERGHIETLVQTKAEPLLAVPRLADVLVPLTVGMLVPVLGWLALALALRAAARWDSASARNGHTRTVTGGGGRLREPTNP